MTASAIVETIQFVTLLVLGAWLLWLSGRRSAEKRADELDRLRVLLDRIDPEDLSEFLKTTSGQDFLTKLVAQATPPEIIEANAIRRAVVLGSIGIGCLVVFAAIMVITAGGMSPHIGGIPAELIMGAAGGLLIFTAGGILLSVRIINRRSSRSQREPP